MKSSISQHLARSPMKTLKPHENIPFPPPAQKSIQLGIEVFMKKRERENLDVDPNPRIQKLKAVIRDSITVKGSPAKQTVACHQCRRHVHPYLSIHCTALKKSGSAQNPSQRRCAVTYCDQCLANRYNEKVETILAHFETSDAHVHDAGYSWSCPVCRGICNCGPCRKNVELAPSA
jgi:hypothetical protein